jgi:hypothetical protein
MRIGSMKNHSRDFFGKNVVSEELHEGQTKPAGKKSTRTSVRHFEDFLMLSWLLTMSLPVSVAR